MSHVEEIFGGFQSLTLTTPADQQLLAVATISVDERGDYQMNLANISGAPIVMTRQQQVTALRLLANGIEAETVFTGEPSLEG